MYQPSLRSRARLVLCMAMIPASCDTEPGDICGMDRKLLKTGQIKPNCRGLPSSPPPGLLLGFRLNSENLNFLLFNKISLNSCPGLADRQLSFFFFLGSPCKVFFSVQYKVNTRIVHTTHHLGSRVQSHGQRGVAEAEEGGHHQPGARQS